MGFVVPIPYRRKRDNLGQKWDYGAYFGAFFKAYNLLNTNSIEMY